jgi:hypothetical protein
MRVGRFVVDSGFGDRRVWCEFAGGWSPSPRHRAQLDLVFVVIETRNCKPVRL